jgi:hypothetical protein
VLVGISNHVKDTDDAVDISLHTPLKLKGAVEGEDEGLVVVGKGKMPFPGINIEDDWDEYPLPLELELLGIVMVEFELYGVPVAETEPLKLEKCDPFAVEVELELTVQDPVLELDVPPELTVLKVVDVIAVELELAVPSPVIELDVAPELIVLKVVDPIAVELERVIVLSVLEEVPVELVMPKVEVLL